MGKRRADKAPAQAGKDRPAGGDPRAYVTLILADQLCGVPVLCVRDVLAKQHIARIPLAPPEVAGNLNLRGRIVTAIDLRRKLRLPPRAAGPPPMCLVIEQGSDLTAFLVDQVCEVTTLQPAEMERNPPTLPQIWADNSLGIYRLGARLLVVLDVDKLLRFNLELAA